MQKYFHIELCPCVASERLFYSPTQLFVRSFLRSFMHCPFILRPKTIKKEREGREERVRTEGEGEGRFTERFHGLNRVVNCSVFCQLVPYYRLIHLVEGEVL